MLEQPLNALYGAAIGLIPTSVPMTSRMTRSCLICFLNGHPRMRIAIGSWLGTRRSYMASQSQPRCGVRLGTLKDVATSL